MKIKIEIDCSNVAFEPNADSEVARILQSLAGKIAFRGINDIKLFDINGNKVGIVEVIE